MCVCVCVCVCLRETQALLPNSPGAMNEYNCYRFANSAEANAFCKAVLAGKMLKDSSRRMGAIIMSRYSRLLCHTSSAGMTKTSADGEKAAQV